MSEESFDPMLSAIERLTSIFQINLDKLISAVHSNTDILAHAIFNSMTVLGNTIIGAKLGETPGATPGKSAFQEAIDLFEGAVENLGEFMVEELQLVKTGVSGTGTGKKQDKQAKGFFKTMKKGLGGMVKASAKMALIGAVMEPINAMIQAFLEPMEMLTPLFESWGTILSQAIIPIVIALMEALMPLTPAFVAIMEALMPVAMFLVSIIHVLIPVMVLLAELVIVIANFFKVIFEGLSILTGVVYQIGGLIEGLADLLTGLFKHVSDFFNNIADAVKNFIDEFIEKSKEFGRNIADWFANIDEEIFGVNIW